MKGVVRRRKILKWESGRLKSMMTEGATESSTWWKQRLYGDSSGKWAWRSRQESVMLLWVLYAKQRGLDFGLKAMRNYWRILSREVTQSNWHYIMKVGGQTEIDSSQFWGDGEFCLQRSTNIIICRDHIWWKTNLNWSEEYINHQ